ncbi:NAD(P)-dependent oxidoreductase [Glutamicibacter endophyticus]|uniref:NAD(P)-dependent oxidoreductase n=1 Tax=Glutamicibacter endophyticus TaxID=1522174 RepID=UPI003AEF7DDE
MTSTSNHPEQRVGIIGLGAMGRPMARHLAAAHGSVAITSRRPKHEVIADLNAGTNTPASAFRWNSNANDMATDCDAILLMLPDLPQIREYLEGPDGLLAGLTHRPGQSPALLLIIGSTCSAVGMRQLAADLHERYGERVDVVDAPVSGGEDGAEAGTLSIMLGGTAPSCARAAEVLAPCGTPVRLGGVGSGQVAKACNQLVVGATIFALGEASVLAERSGLDLAAMWDLLGGGYASSRLLDSRKERLVTNDDSPSGAIKYLLKDLQSAQEIARDTAVNATLLPTLQQAVLEVINAGLGDRDLSVTKRFTAER